MKAVIKLHLKENIKKNSFIIFGILGTIITLIVLFQLEFSVNGVQATSDHAVYGIQWKILSVIASLAGVSISMNIISNHRQGTKRELLKLHGLTLEKQYLSLISGNVIVTSLMALIFCTGMFIQIIIKGGNITVLGFITAVFLYLLTIMTLTVLVSLLTLILPSAVAALLGVLAVALGSVRGTLQLLVGNKGGMFGSVAGFFLKLIPPLDQFGNLIRDFFMWGFFEHGKLYYGKLFGSLFYLWALIGITYLTVKVVARNEN